MRRLPVLAAVGLLAALLAVPSLAVVGKRFSMQLGSTVTITGQTGSDVGKQSRAVGKVVISGRWANGRWHVLTTTKTDSVGHYRFTLVARRRGNLALRIAPPDHQPQRYLLHIY